MLGQQLLFTKGFRDLRTKPARPAGDSADLPLRSNAFLTLPIA
jgi:hypothetical protein